MLHSHTTNISMTTHCSSSKNTHVSEWMTITCSSVLKSKNFLDFLVKPLRKLALWGLFKIKHICMSTRDIATENTTNSSSSSFHDVLKKIIQTFLRVTGGLHHLKPLWHADIPWCHRALYITLGLIGSLRMQPQNSTENFQQNRNFC